MNNIPFAFQLYESELFCLSQQLRLSESYQQIIVFRDKPIKPYYLDNYFLLDERTEQFIIDKKINQLMQNASWKYKYDYIAKVDSQIEFENNINILEELIKKYALGSSIKKINQDFSSSNTLIIVFLKVFKLQKSFEIEEKKKINTIIYKLHNNKYNFDINEIQKVITNNFFDYIKNEIIHLLKTNGNFIDIYKNTEDGNKKLLKRFELQYSTSEKSLTQNKKHHQDMAKIDYSKFYKKVIEIEPTIRPLIDKIRKILPPQNGENKVLLKAIRKGDASAYKRIFESHLRGVLKIAYNHRYKTPYSISDSFQDGIFGLIDAINKYDVVNHDQPFGGYCWYWVIQRMERSDHLLETAFRIPEHFKTKIIPLYNYLLNHNIKVSDEGFIKDEDIRQIISELEIPNDIFENLYPYSLVPISYEYYNSKNLNLSDNGLFAEEEQNKMETYLLNKELYTILNQLDPKEKDVLIRRYGLNNSKEETLQEIADVYGVTRERVRQIESRSLHHLKKKLLKSFIPDYLGYSKDDVLCLLDKDS